MSQITIVGGGLAGLTAAIACAEEGASVRLLEAHESSAGERAAPTAPTRQTSVPTSSTRTARSGDG